MIRSRFGEPSSCLRPGRLADLAGADELVLVHPGPDHLRELLAAVEEVVVGPVEHLAADLQDLLAGHVAGGDLVHVVLELGGHLRRRHPQHVLAERLVHRDPRLRGLGRVVVDVAAVVELLDDVGAGGLRPEASSSIISISLPCEIREGGWVSLSTIHGAPSRSSFWPSSSAGSSLSAERA